MRHLAAVKGLTAATSPHPRTDGGPGGRLPSHPTPSCWCTFSATRRLLSHRKYTAAQYSDLDKKKSK
jgi:hypothetical protein